MLKFVILDTYMTFPLCCPKSWTHKSNTKWTLGWNSFAVSKVKNQLSVSTFQMMLVCSVSGFSKPWLLSYKWDSFYLWCSDNTVPTHTHTHAHTHTLPLPAYTWRSLDTCKAEVWDNEIRTPCSCSLLCPVDTLSSAMSPWGETCYTSAVNTPAFN